jgi:hypothetical protein
MYTNQAKTENPQTKKGFESALKKKDYTTAKQVLKQSSDVGFDLAGSSATFRSQMELLEVEVPIIWGSVHHKSVDWGRRNEKSPPNFRPFR